MPDVLNSQQKHQFRQLLQIYEDIFRNRSGKANVKGHSVKERKLCLSHLPRDRIEQSPPFALTGLDFAGSIYVKNSKEKCYMLFCTFAVTKALHLELVTSLTTEAFLLAFRRFISRSRLCTVIYSDNAKTFKRAEIELRRLWTVITHPDVKEFCASRGMKWKYIFERDCVVDKKVLLKRFNYRERLLNNFWRQWRKDYLLNLKSAHFANPTKETEFKINDIVLIHDDRLPEAYGNWVK
ncbi:integrase catalytic domain-containing protein [Trichonephila clavipes]|nr:integrase catalytic domain-containing protein [Trichonephila clavipes]